MITYLITDYEPVSAFSLRPSNVSSKAGKSLLCPTPYAIKMALLDRLIRVYGVDDIVNTLFAHIRDLKFHVQLPLATAINRTFQTIQDKDDKGDKNWKSSISQREYCFQAGVLRIATETTPDFADVLAQAFGMINYFGRKGSFMQLVAYHHADVLPQAGFVDISQPTTTLKRGFLQRMDDMQHEKPDGKKMRPVTFDDVSVLNPKADGARRSYTVVFPYELAYHGQNHTVYQLKER